VHHFSAAVGSGSRLRTILIVTLLTITVWVPGVIAALLVNVAASKN